MYVFKYYIYKYSLSMAVSTSGQHCYRALVKSKEVWVGVQFLVDI